MRDPEPVPDSPDDNEPDTLATPEGDAEAGPGAPLTPAPNGMQTPRGNAPAPYDSDKKPEGHSPEGIEKFIDEVVRGEYM